MKLCKNCKYYTLVFMDLTRCASPKTTKIDPITGKLNMRSCYISRREMSNNMCGPRATYFEEREVKNFWRWLVEVFRR